MPAHRTSRRRLRAAASTGLTVLVAPTALTGCSGDDEPSSVVSKAASAAESVGADVTGAASSLASEASEAFESATAAAGRKLDEIKGGVDAKDAVKLGSPTADADGRTTVEVTAENTTDATRSFAVQVNFTDAKGNWRDTVVVTVSDVPADGTGTATARSNRELTGEVKAEVERALRY